MDILYLSYLGWSSVGCIVLPRSGDLPSSVSITYLPEMIRLTIADC